MTTVTSKNNVYTYFTTAPWWGWQLLLEDKARNRFLIIAVTVTRLHWILKASLGGRGWFMTALFHELVVGNSTHDCLACQAAMEQVGISLNLHVQMFWLRWCQKIKLSFIGAYYSDGENGYTSERTNEEPIFVMNQWTETKHLARRALGLYSE